MHVVQQVKLLQPPENALPSAARVAAGFLPDPTTAPKAAMRFNSQKMLDKTEHILFIEFMSGGRFDDYIVAARKNETPFPEPVLWRILECCEFVSLTLLLRALLTGWQCSEALLAWHIHEVLDSPRKREGHRLTTSRSTRKPSRTCLILAGCQPFLP
jgi:hypothetical protein